MRRLVVTGAALAVLASSGVAEATTPPDTAPTTEEGAAETVTAEESAVADTASADTAAADENAPATVYDESGEPVATITVVGTQTEWTEYAEGAEPDEGHEYVQVTVDVASTVTEGSFGISVGDFILQDQYGFARVREQSPPRSRPKLAKTSSAKPTLRTANHLNSLSRSRSQRTSVRSRSSTAPTTIAWSTSPKSDRRSSSALTLRPSGRGVGRGGVRPRPRVVPAVDFDASHRRCCWGR